MRPGERIEIPFAEIGRRTVCYYVSHLSKMLGREYHMRTARSNSTYVITREA